MKTRLPRPTPPVIAAPVKTGYIVDVATDNAVFKAITVYRTYQGAATGVGGVSPG
jgi:hypothetical protein